ncbi:hypothetical protein [Amycolatopsis sp. NPDC059657]|uniref:hypothetical protein n=1 Tax=Amycolatopsis sp. NPDC059657 TaxID=3346899 RepID=UPI003670ED1E
MKRAKRLLPVVVVAVVLSPQVAEATKDRPSVPDLKAGVAAEALAASAFGNGIFQVYQKRGGTGQPGAGQFTVATGPRHPAGAGLDVLYGAGTPGTSYLVVRDETDKVDYVQGQMLTHSGEVSLDNHYSYLNVDGATSTIGWSPTDKLSIRLNISVTGDTAANSRVSVHTKITDTNTVKHRFRVQYLWDTAPAGDDGAVSQPRVRDVAYDPFDPTVGVEQTVTDRAGDLIVADKASTLAVALSGVDTATSLPDSVKYLCWPDAIFAPFGGYVTDPARDVSSPASTCRNYRGNPDSGVQYVWTAVPAADTGTVDVGAALRTSPPVARPSKITAVPPLLGAARATLTDTATGKPIAGKPVAFTAGGTTYCTEPTDAQGIAICRKLLGLLGYDATYPGGAVWATSTAHGGL